MKCIKYTKFSIYPLNRIWKHGLLSFIQSLNIKRIPVYTWEYTSVMITRKKLSRLISQFEREYLEWTLIISVTWILLQIDYITFRCYLARILILQRLNIRISFNMKTTNSLFIMSYVKALWKYVFINMMKLIPTPRRFSCENYTMVETDHWIICSNHSVVWYKTKWRKWGVGRLCFATLPIGEGLEKYDTWDHIVMCWIY